MRETQIESLVRIQADSAMLDGELIVPGGASAVVLFAHGSGSSRHSPRNKYVAGVLRQAGLATLLLDLLTAEEEDKDIYTGEFRFNIRLLADRLAAATDWLLRNPQTNDLKVGYFGASTGAAAALIAETERPGKVFAVVSRGGRPDMAKEALQNVAAPTLLIVGGDDEVVIDLNEEALTRIRAEKSLEIVPGATHLFEELGTLEKVAELASAWFVRHL